MTDYEELQQWLDAETAKAEAAERAAKAMAFKMPTFEHMKFELKCSLYAKAIGVNRE